MDFKSRPGLVPCVLIGQLHRAYKDILTILGLGVGISHGPAAGPNKSRKSGWWRPEDFNGTAVWMSGQLTNDLTHGKHL